MVNKKTVGGCAALAIVLLACSSWAQSETPSPTAAKGKSSPYSKQTNKKQQPATKDNFGTEALPFVIKIQTPPSAEANPEDTKKKEDEYPTDWWMVGVTFLLVAVGIAQLILFFVQLRLIRESLADAKKAADAAQEAAKAAHASASAIPRIEQAYLFLEWDIEHSVFPKELEAPNPRESFFRFRFKNHGKTPAVLRVLRDEGAVFSTHEPTRTANIIHSAVEGYIIGSGEISREFKCPFLVSKAELDEIQRGKLHLFFFGTIEYQDVFGELHETGFCGEFMYRSGKILMHPANKQYNYFT